MLKSTPKKLIVPEVAPQTSPNFWGNVWAVFEDILSYSTFCLISTSIAVVITMVFFMNRFKRERNVSPAGIIKEQSFLAKNNASVYEKTAGDGDKIEVKEVKAEKEAMDKDGVESENPDTSEGQDGSEEDLPWLLQKAPSQTTLSEDKENSANDDKQSEGTESEKSQDLARSTKSAAGDITGAVKKGVTETEEEE